MTDLDKHTGKLISGIPAIRQGIETILRTRQGERVFRPEFGVPFQNEDGTAGPGLSADRVERECVEALEKYEPRIESVKVVPEIGQNGMLTSVAVSYVSKEGGTSDTIKVEYSAWPKR